MEPRKETQLDGASLSRFHDHYMRLRAIAIAGINDEVRAVHAEWARLKTAADPMWTSHGILIDLGADVEVVGIAYQGTIADDTPWMDLTMAHFWRHMTAVTDAKIRLARAVEGPRARRVK